ncbi:hypothetical protein RR48_11149 [Papilio machaon]|uniref:C2H2-type domain-containing protein n=1 Tax=Papilio machaon TaxID=76193 RepID=A0A194QPZ3_PAPMA|nr:hypothetical protein RR48_11149 [Papilio machaon]
MPKLQIDEVYAKNNVHPMLINFQNGYTTGKFRPSECVLLQDENSKTTIATQINDFVYTGEEEKEDLSKTIIIARNKNTGKVRLIEVGTAELKPVLKVDLDSTQLLETSNLELSRKFGSKKQKQQVEQREKLKVNVQIVNEQMQNVTQEVSVDNLDLSSYENPDSDDFYIPPINRDAQKPEQIYELDKILTEDEFEKIYSELEGKDYTSDVPPWVANLMASKKNPKHIVLGVYAGVLLKLYLMLVKDIPKKMFTACKLSPTLNNIIHSVDKPVLACFICYAIIKRCRKFQQQAIKSNELLEKICDGDELFQLIESQKNQQEYFQFTPIYHLQLEPGNEGVDYKSKNNFIPTLIKNETDNRVEEDGIDNQDSANTMGLNFDTFQERMSDSEDDIPLIAIGSRKIKKNTKTIKKRRNKDCKDNKVDAKEIELTEEEQRLELLERATSDNYLKSPYKCEKCYKGFVDPQAFTNHMEKHEKTMFYICVQISSRSVELFRRYL